MATIQTSIVMADNITSTLFGITDALNLTLSAFRGVQDTASHDIDMASLDGAREHLNAATIATQQLRAELNRVNPKAVSVEVTPIWNMQRSPEVFQSTGTQRLNLEVGSLQDITSQVMAAQQRIGEQALTIDLLPPNGVQDIAATNRRIEELGQKLVALQSLDVSTMDDTSVARMSSEMESLRQGMTGVANLQERINAAAASGDVSGLNAGVNQLNGLAEQLERRVRASTTAIEELSRVEWQTPQSIEIFENSGVQRFREEMASATALMDSLSDSQSALTAQAANMTIMPPNAVGDIESMNSRIAGLQERLQELSAVQLNGVGAEQASGEIEHLRQTLNQMLQIQEQVKTSMGNFDVSGANAAFNQLNSLIDGTERNFRDRLSQIRDMDLRNAAWTTPQNIEIFNTDGVERFRSEIADAEALMNRFAQSQNALSLQGMNSVALDILPPNALEDMDAMNARVAGLQERLQELATVQLNDMDAGQASGEIEGLRQTLNQALQIQEQFSSALGNFDVSGANAAFNQLNGLIDGTERNFRDRLTSIQDMDLNNAAWTTPQTVDIIVGSGFERYRQEVQSADGMLERLTTAQQQIGQQAANMRFLPPNATSDLNSMATRIQALRKQIETMQSKRIQVVGVQQANSEMEGLRQKLHQALQTQEDLNGALNNMDVSAANAAYSRLNDIVDSTERNIRDNIAEQQDFNAELRNGSSAADGLLGKIAGMAAAYLSVQGAKKVLDLSDTMAQNTARLGLLVDVDDDGAVQALQDKIYLSAQRSRGDYLELTGTVSKLGLLAGDAFSSNDEIIAFTEQMNKNFAIGGASIQEQTSAMHQLTQAMASGRLQGDEYNSIIENAPLLANAIKEYMTAAGVEGTMKEWASDGLLTAEVIKGALFSVADDTNERFKNMPMTFADVATNIKNNALMAFQPVLTRLNKIADSPAFQTLVDNAIGALVTVAGVVMDIFDAAAAVAQFARDNWSWLEPVIWGVVAAFVAWKTITFVMGIALGIKAAAEMLATGATLANTAAQWGLNAALLANPIILVIVVIVAIIAAILAWINRTVGLKIAWLIVVNALLTALDLLKIGFFAGVYFVLDLFDRMKLGMMIAGTAIANFMGDMKANVLTILQNMVNGAISIINDFIGILNKLPGVNVELIEQVTFGTKAQLENEAAKQVRENALNDHRSEIEANIQGRADALLVMKDDANAAMAERLAKIEELKLERTRKDGKDKDRRDEKDNGYNYEIPDYASDIAAINANTSDLKSIGEEDLKLWRDIAERESIDKFTTAEIHVNFGGITNNVNSEMDLDGIITRVADGLEEALPVVAGVHG